MNAEFIHDLLDVKVDLLTSAQIEDARKSLDATMDVGGVTS